LFDTSTAREVSVEVRSDSINLASNGLIAVAIYTTDDFDAADVDAATVEFAGALAVQWAMEDVDDDGDLDMILHFDIRDTDLAIIYNQSLGDDADGDGVLDSTHQMATVSLTGETVDGQQILGADEVDLFFSGKALRELLDQLALAGSL
jgi:hypothetical protein